MLRRMTLLHRFQLIPVMLTACRGIGVARAQAGVGSCIMVHPFRTAPAPAAFFSCLTATVMRVVPVAVLAVVVVVFGMLVACCAVPPLLVLVPLARMVIPSGRGIVPIVTLLPLLLWLMPLPVMGLVLIVLGTAAAGLRCGTGPGLGFVACQVCIQTDLWLRRCLVFCFRFIRLAAFSARLFEMSLEFSLPVSHVTHGSWCFCCALIGT
mmetsp:Transcript_15856/g.47715  ORF Transcript_15856/g.47715 Transcript_15856/m.47715 type:complete len:209 (-) Transcript_15856:1327-1953(-)